MTRCWRTFIVRLLRTAEAFCIVCQSHWLTHIRSCFVQVPASACQGFEAAPFYKLSRRHHYTPAPPSVGKEDIPWNLHPGLILRQANVRQSVSYTYSATCSAHTYFQERRTISTPAWGSEPFLDSKQGLDSLKTNQDADPKSSATHDDENESAAESDDSNVTKETSNAELLEAADAARQAKICLGGRPTREIKEYRPEDSKLLPMADDHPRGKLYSGPARPIPPPKVSWEETLYGDYCAEEMRHFRSELMAWESFLRSVRRDWVRHNEAAGGTVPPPPPVLEWDPLDLHERYLEFLRKTRSEDEKRHDDLATVIRFNFWPYRIFVDHIKAVERQVDQMRREQGLTDHTSAEADDPETSSVHQATPQPASSLSTNSRGDGASGAVLAHNMTSTEFQYAISDHSMRIWLGGATTQTPKITPSAAPAEDTSAEGDNNPRCMPEKPSHLDKFETEPGSGCDGTGSVPEPRNQAERGKNQAGQEAEGEKHDVTNSEAGDDVPRELESGRKHREKKIRGPWSSEDPADAESDSDGSLSGKRVGAVKQQWQTSGPPVTTLRRSKRIAEANAKKKTKGT